jgi:hypothetical protein
MVSIFVIFLLKWRETGAIVSPILFSIYHDLLLTELQTAAVGCSPFRWPTLVILFY